MVARKKTEMITGLDIGSTAIRVAVGQLTYEADGRASLQIVGAAEVPSYGIQKGVVVSIEEAISSVSHALEKIERLVGVPIENTWVGITGTDIISENSRGVISVAKADGEISPEDVERAIEAARTIAVPLNYDMLHVMPRSYTVDGQHGIKDPVGMTGLRLEVDTQIIHGISSHLKNVSKSVYRTGIDIDDIVLSALATADAVVTSRQKEIGVGVVNIGGSTSSLVVYESGDVIHTAVLPIGSEHITNDLAIGLRTSIDVAEKIKIEHGYCVSSHIPKREKVDLSPFGSEEVVTRNYISQIVEARATEILEKINDELIKIGKSGLLPAGIVFTGGGAKIGGLIDLSKDVLKLPASIGYPIDIPSITSQSNDISFTSAIGLVKWGAKLNDNPRAGIARPSSKNPISTKKILNQLRKAGEWLMP